MILEGISHAHTTYSYDGKLPIKEFKEFFKEQGTEFVLITEHSDFIEPKDALRFIKDCHNLSDGTITLIPGFEVPYKDAHILMIGVTGFLKNGQNSAEELKEWRKLAKLAVWAHPHRNRYLLYDAIKEVIDGVEVWNSQYDGKYVPRMKVLNSLKGLRLRKDNVYAFGGLDFHRPEHNQGPMLVLEVDRNEEGQIIEALKTGKYVIKSRQVTIDATGHVLKGAPLLMNVISGLSVGSITFLKKVSAFAAKFHLPVPKGIKVALRKRL